MEETPRVPSAEERAKEKWKASEASVSESLVAKVNRIISERISRPDADISNADIESSVVGMKNETDSRLKAIIEAANENNLSRNGRVILIAASATLVERKVIPRE